MLFVINTLEQKKSLCHKNNYTFFFSKSCKIDSYLVRNIYGLQILLNYLPCVANICMCGNNGAYLCRSERHRSEGAEGRHELGWAELLQDTGSQQGQKRAKLRDSLRSETGGRLQVRRFQDQAGNLDTKQKATTNLRLFYMYHSHTKMYHGFITNKTIKTWLLLLNCGNHKWIIV